MTPLLDALSAFPAPQREQLLRVHLARSAAEVLGVAPESLLAGAPLTADPDSLARLGERLEADLGVRLTNVAGLGIDLLLHRVLEEMEAARGRGTARELAPAELRLWVLDRLTTGSPVCNLPVALRLRGTLDERALGRSLEEVVGRHESLRTSFPAEEGRPSAITHPPGPVSMPLVDLSHLPAAEREDTALERAREEVRRRFDLARGPLLRALLLRLSVDDHILVITCHHIVVDGYSFVVLSRELSVCYEAFRTGGRPALPPLPPLALESGGADAERDLAYFQKKLAGVPIDLDLPTDRPRPPTRSGRGAWVRRGLSEALVQELKQLCARESATVFMGLLGAFQMLTGRLAGQSELVVGVPAANRMTGTHDRVGCFLRMLPIPADLTGDPSFRQLLRRVRKDALEAYEHADVPFDRLVEALSERQDPSRTPLYQVMIVLRGNALPELRLHGLSVTRVPLNTGSSLYDLTLMLDEVEGGIDATLEFATDLFDPASASRMLSQFETLLAAAVRSPDEPARRLALVADERPLIVTATGADPETALRGRAASGARPVVLVGEDAPIPEGTLDERIRARASAAPDAVAIVSGTESLTYGELETRSRDLAEALREAGVTPGSRVALPLARSPELLVSMLAVLRAGSAYVPVDVDQPAERLALLENACHASIVLGPAGLEPRLPHKARHPSPGPASPAALTSPELRPAYVLHTSGSTGRPKGVIVAHRSVVSFASVMSGALGLTVRDRVLQFCSPAFDASVLEIFPALMGGAAVVLRSEEMSASPRHFWEECRERAITIAVLPVAFFHRLTAHEETLAPPPSLRAILVGGESLRPEHLATWQRRVGPRVRLFNQYGATENTVAATQWEAPPGARRVSLGRPLPNTHVLVLDPAGRPCPVGVAGEIAVGGTGVALGYLDDAELTRARFVPHPLPELGGERIYRTGDLGRILPDCTLQFLGRDDGQLKIRGYRIDAGEVEAALLQQAGITEAAVDVRELSGEKHLVAYLVGAAGIREGELQAFLRGKLPRHMIPSRFVRVDALPRLLGGKVDRRALPAPSAERPEQSATPPRDAVELALVQIWEEVLGVRPIGVQDDVYELGAHSLVVVAALAGVEKRLGRSLAPPDLYEAPTIEEQARLLRSSAPADAEAPLVALGSRGASAPLFCVDPGGDSALCYLRLAQHLDGRGVLGVRSAGTAGSVEEAATRFASAIRGAQAAGPYRICGWSVGGVLAFETARVLEAEGDAVHLTLIDARTPAWYARSGGAPREDAVPELARRLGLLPPLPRDPGELLRRAHDERRLPMDMDGPGLERLLEVQEAIRSSLRRYRPGPISGSITLFRAQDPPGQIDDDYAWSPLAGTLEVLTLPGDHYSLLTEPYVAALAGELGSRLG
jgi:amino acid adenylation domain-containing protein